MKTKPYIEKQKLGPHGEVTLPPDYLKELGLYPGESEVELRRAGKDLLLSPVEEAVAYKKKCLDPVKALTGSLEIDPQLADAILEADYQPEEA